MTKTLPMPLPRNIGLTERTLRALLLPLLDTAGMTFPDWVVLTTLQEDGAMPDAALIARLIDGHVTSAEGAADVLAGITAKGWIAAEAGNLALTDKGLGVYAPARREVDAIIAKLFNELPEEDLAATRRTLAEIAHRAASMIGGGG